MSVPTSVFKEFIRKVYRAAQAASVDRDVYLDGLADVALATWESGKTLSSSSTNGTTASYELFYGWNPESLLENIARARDYVSYATVTLALAEIKAIRHVSSKFTTIKK